MLNAGSFSPQNTATVNGIGTTLYPMLLCRIHNPILMRPTSVLTELRIVEVFLHTFLREGAQRRLGKSDYIRSLQRFERWVKTSSNVDAVHPCLKGNHDD